MRQSYGRIPSRRERAGAAVRGAARARGAGSVEVELPDGARVGDVWGALDLGDEPAGILFAVNKAYAERERGALARATRSR